MSSWSSDAAGVSVTLTAPKVQAGQTLFSSSFGYSVLEFIGEGCYGKVAKCRNLATKESVAVKILKKDIHFIPDTEKEVSMLEVISVLNPDHTNVVKFFERFEYMGQTCLAFEMLDRSLYQLVQERDWKPLPLNEIRPIAKQLLVALDALKGIGILHTDIKPDNVMFVNMQDQPLKIKLIDFGEAIPASKVQPGMELQPTGYRAPEVALGLPFTEAIDVWGVGCTMAFLYLAENLFPVDCDYQMMKCMVEVLGQPEDHLLCPGIYTQYYFIEEEAANRPTWRLMLPEEYIVANDVKVEERHSFIDLPSSLDDLVNIYPKGEAAELEDRKAFVDLIKQLLHLDGDQRISPHRALQNPFITESHLTEHTDSRAHPDTTGTMISICPMEASANRANTSAASEPGFYFRGLPSGSNDDGSAIRSFDGTKAIVFNENGPTTLSSDRDQVTYSDEDWADWSFDGGQPPYKYYEDTAFWYSDGVLPPYTYYEDPALWSSDGGQPPDSYDEDLAYWSSDEGLTPFSYEKGPAVWSSDGRLPPYTHYEDSAFLSSDGGQPPDSYDEDLASWSSDEGLPPFFYEKGPAVWYSDGRLPPYTHYEDSAFLSPDGGLPRCTYAEDTAVWSSVEGLPPYSYDEDPVVCSSAGGLPPSSYDADPATLSSNGGQPPYPYDEDPTAWSSDGGLPPFSSVEDPASWSSDGAKPTDYTVAASASTGGPKRMIKWSYRFFSQIMATLCCCCRTTVEV